MEQTLLTYITKYLNNAPCFYGNPEWKKQTQRVFKFGEWQESHQLESLVGWNLDPHHYVSKFYRLRQNNEHVL